MQLQNCKFLDKHSIHRKNIQFKKKKINNLNNKIVSSNSICFNHNNLFNFKKRKKNHRNIQNYIIKFSFLNKKISFHHILFLFPTNIFNIVYQHIPSHFSKLIIHACAFNFSLNWKIIFTRQSFDNSNMIYFILLDDHNRVHFKVS